MSLSGRRSVGDRKSLLYKLVTYGLLSAVMISAPTLTVAQNVIGQQNGASKPAEKAKKRAENKSAKKIDKTTQNAENKAETENNSTTIVTNAQALDKVVVTASGFEQTVTDAPASISVIPREELEKTAFRDLGDALRNVQGVAVTGTASAQDIYIRGLPGDYTLILVDGKRQSTREARTNGSAGFEQSFIPPASAIDRIEVVRGPMSSLYGSDAMGGVVNIITRKVPEKWTGTLSVDGTANQYNDYGNAIQGNYYLAGPVFKDVVGLQFWGRGYGREEDRIVSGMPKKKDVDYTGKITITPNQDNDFTFEAGHTRLRRYSTVGNNVDSAKSNGADSFNNNDRDHWVASYTGRFSWTTAEISVLQETARRTNYSWDNKLNNFAPNLRSPAIRNTVVDSKLTTPFQLFGSHTLVTGGQFTRGDLTDQNPGLRNNRDERFAIEQWAGFAEDEWWLTDTFSLTGGIRMDHHEIYGQHWSPRGYAVWHATDHITLKGGITTGFQAPSIRSIAPGYAYTTGGRSCFYGRTTPPKGKRRCAVILAAPGLAPEKSTSYEFSALWDNMDNLQFGATYFYTDFKDKITNREAFDANGNAIEWDRDPNYVIFENLNIDDAVLQGVELTGSWMITETVSLRGNYTYTKSEQKTGDYMGFPLARTPKHLANIRAEWKTPVENLETWVGGNYHGTESSIGFRSRTGGTEIYNDNGEVVGRKFPGYFTADIGGSYSFNENVKLNAAVYNIFNKRVGVDEFNNVVEGRRFWLNMISTF